MTADLEDAPGEAMAAGVSVAPHVAITSSATNTTRRAVEPTDPTGVANSMTRTSQ